MSGKTQRPVCDSGTVYGLSQSRRNSRWTDDGLSGSRPSHRGERRDQNSGSGWRRRAVPLYRRIEAGQPGAACLPAVREDHSSGM